MPKVIVYVPAAAWKRLEERGLNPAEAVRDFARRGYELNEPPNSGASVGNSAVTDSAPEQREERMEPVAPSVHPERAAPEEDHFKPHPKAR